MLEEMTKVLGETYFNLRLLEDENILLKAQLKEAQAEVERLKSGKDGKSDA